LGYRGRHRGGRRVVGSLDRAAPDRIALPAIRDGASATLVRLIFYLLGNTKQFLFLAIALYVGQEILAFPPRAEHIIETWC
jgi:hypothetical protein